MQGSILRLFRFRPRGPGSVVDAILRDSMAPRLASIAGVRHVHVGRRGPDESGERLIVSVWESHDAMAAGTHGSNGSGGLEVGIAGDIAEPTLEVLPVAVDLPFELAAEPGILRVFRGETRDGVMDAYLEDVRTGTVKDVGAGHGPMALFLGLSSPTCFVTVSIWTGWDVIEAATGGNLRVPVATRHANRLVGGTASHYEVLPAALTKPARTS